MAREKMKIRMTRAAEEKHIGLGYEPEENSIVTRVLEVFNYYNYFYDRKKAVLWLEDYLRVNQSNILKQKDTSKASTTMGWIARMLSRNVSLPPETTDWFERQLNLLPENHKKKVQNLIRISDTPEMKAIALIDEMLDNGDVSEISQINDYNLSPASLKKMADRYQNQLDELEEIKKDDQLKEAYSNFSPKQIKLMKGNLEVVLNTLGVKRENKRRARKIRKVVTRDNFKEINFVEKDEETGIVTLSPEHIKGQTMVLFYMPKNRKLRYFEAKAGTTLNVEGKNLVNVDPDKSFGRTLRDPKNQLKKFVGVGKRAFRKEWDALTTKEIPQATFQIHKNHMLIARY